MVCTSLTHGLLMNEVGSGQLRFKAFCEKAGDSTRREKKKKTESRESIGIDV